MDVCSSQARCVCLYKEADTEQLTIIFSAVVFKMHYQELMSKDDEIRKLTAVIQALSGR